MPLLRILFVYLQKPKHRIDMEKKEITNKPKEIKAEIFSIEIIDKCDDSEFETPYESEELNEYKRKATFCAHVCKLSIVVFIICILGLIFIGLNTFCFWMVLASTGAFFGSLQLGLSYVNKLT